MKAVPGIYGSSRLSIVNKGNDPADCTPEHVVENPGEFGSGGCMNCHFSAGTDSSFIWADGIEEQIPLN